MPMNPVKTPFVKMSFTPDVPSSALTANEYNAGQNIETNVRGVNSVSGDQYILAQVPGNQIFVTSGFGSNGIYYWIVATEQGQWYEIDQTGGITNITPAVGGQIASTSTGPQSTNPPGGYGPQVSPGTTYNVHQTSSTGLGTGATFHIVVNTYGAPWQNATITLTNSGQFYNVGDVIYIGGSQFGVEDGGNEDLYLTITGLSTSGGYYGTYSTSTVITASWNGTIVFLNDETNPPMYFSPGNWGQIRLYDNSPDNYIWNYDVGYDSTGNIVPLYSSLTAGFVRVYNSPNVGSLLVAGNLTGNINANVVPSGGTVQNLPTTVRWSQNFGINSGPTTWAPTIYNIANQVEMPVRGPIKDGFSLNGNFYICSYWDTCLMSPIAYTSTTAPVFGIKIVSQGRGLINENCWAVVDNVAFGVDARDIWQFDGGAFTPIGNQRVKNYFYNNLNNAYTNQIFMINNTEKYQIEIYYPSLASTGTCDQMISYRYDLDAWQPPRQVTEATMATEAPRIINGNINLATRGVDYSTYNTYTIGTTNQFQNFISGYCTGTSGANATSSSYYQASQKSTSGTGTGLILNIHMDYNNASYSNNASLYAIVNAGNNYVVGDTVVFSGANLGGSDGTNDLTITVSEVTTTSQVGQLIQKDTGTSFIGNANISSYFQRDNISFGQPYSASVLVHRVLPEVYGTGNITVTIGGADSVANVVVFKPNVTIPIQTSNPWAQIDQNEARVVTLQVGANSNVTSWQLTEADWQITVVQDTR